MGVNSSRPGKAQRKGGAHPVKGRGKGTTAGKGPGVPLEDRTCQREGCHAATKKQATWGGSSTCHCCGLSLTATLPVEKLVGWAFQARLDAKAAALDAPKTPAAVAAPSAEPNKPAGKGTAPKASQNADQMAAKKAEMLAALKSVTAAAPVQTTPLQEVAKVFVEHAHTSSKLEYDDEAKAHFKRLDENAEQLLAFATEPLSI